MAERLVAYDEATRTATLTDAGRRFIAPRGSAFQAAGRGFPGSREGLAAAAGVGGAPSPGCRSLSAVHDSSSR